MRLINIGGHRCLRFTMHGLPRLFCAASYFKLAQCVVHHWWAERRQLRRKPDRILVDREGVAYPPTREVKLQAKK